MNLSQLTTAIQNTLLVYAICASIALLLGTFLAVFLIRTNVGGRRLAWVAIGSQIAVPLYVFAGGWSAGFGLQGWYSSLGIQGSSPLGAATLVGGHRALVAVAIIHALAAIPWVALLVALGLMWTHRGQEEQAMIDGGWWNAIVRSMLPKLRIWLAAAAAWCAVPILTEMVISNLYQVPTVAEQVYLDVSRGVVSPLTYATSICLCSLPLILVGWAILRRFPNWQDITFRSSQFRAPVLDLGVWRVPLSIVVWLLVATLVLLPILSLIAKAGWKPYTGTDGRTQYGWSMQRLATTAYESTVLFQAEFFWSAILSISAGSLALIVAAAIYAFAGKRSRNVTSLFMLLLISLPGPLVGMLVIWLLNRSQPAWLGYLYDHTITAPILAQQFRLLPLAWIGVITCTGPIARGTWEQAQLDGLTRSQMLRSVFLPQAGGPLFVFWILLCVLSIGELSCSILVLPPGVTTVSMRLFEMLHFGMRHQDSGICGILLLFGWGVSFAVWKTLRER